MAKAKNSHWKQRVQGHPWQKHTELKTNSRERERERLFPTAFKKWIGSLAVSVPARIISCAQVDPLRFLLTAKAEKFLNFFFHSPAALGSSIF